MSQPHLTKSISRKLKQILQKLQQPQRSHMSSLSRKNICPPSGHFWVDEFLFPIGVGYVTLFKEGKTFQIISTAESSNESKAPLKKDNVVLGCPRKLVNG